MPLALPARDDRTFDSLMADARARIPRLAAGWTDHNAHDPGITLIELFAWLTETNLFRAGRVSDASRRAFLHWFGLVARGPTVAHAVLALACAPGTPTAIALPGDSAVTGTGKEVFTTAWPIQVQPVRLQKVFVPGLPALVDRTAALARGEAVATFGPRAATGDAVYFAFDRPLSGELSLYLSTGAPARDEITRARLQQEDQDAPCPGWDWRRHYNVETAWEARAADGWKAVRVLADDTRALSLSGFVRLSIDVSHVTGGPDPALAFLRCRIARGVFECSPTLAAVVANAVAARHQGPPFAAPTMTSDGRAGQRFSIARDTVVTEATQVIVSANGGGKPWPVALDWDRVGPEDPVVVLDPVAGEIRFGNGRVGRVPPQGAAIEVSARLGGGEAGNLDAGSLDRFAAGSGDPALSVKQPFAAWGGAPGETLADLQGRLLDRLARPTRAVSALDIEQLVRETPGVPVGRVRVILQHHPALPGLPAAGCVTVVIIPDCPGPRPEPTAGMLAAVRRHLARRRPVTTELFVIGPTYTTITVRAHLQAVAGASGIAAAAHARLDAYFNPLTGGPEGNGWTVGRDVYRADILALLQGTPGVERVDGLTLIAGAGSDAVSYCGNVPICPSSLIASGAHELTSTEIARTR